MRFKNLIALLMTLCFVQVVSAQVNPVRLDIYEVDTSHYPEIDLYFSAFNTQTGRIIPDVRPSILSLTQDGTPVEILDITTAGDTDRTVELIICFDLTQSVSNSFIDEQKRTAFALIDALDVNDHVGITVFSGNEASNPVPISPDHDAARDYIDEIGVGTSASNVFIDGVQTSINAFTSPASNTRRAAVILTDVTDPHSNQELESSQVIQNALNQQVTIYMIGFNDAAEDVLLEYTQATNGFTYLQRELEDSLTRLAEDVADIIRQEYVVTAQGIGQADNGASNITLSLDLGTSFIGTASTQANRLPRTIQVDVSNIDSTVPQAGTIQLEPTITYDDKTIPTIKSVNYALQRPGQPNENLRAAGSAEVNFLWDTTNTPGGQYNIVVEVTDSVGNVGTATKPIIIDSPLALEFIRPTVSPISQLAEVQSGVVEVEVAVESVYAIGEVKLLVNGEAVGTPLTQAPYIFQWNTGNQNAAGVYYLSVEAVDVNGQRAIETLNVEVQISGGWLPIVLLIGLAIFIIIILIIFMLLMRRRSNNQVDEMPAADMSPNMIPPMPVGAASQNRVPNIVVLHAPGANQQVLPLHQPQSHIGRHHTDNDLVIYDDVKKSVSRRHAVIAFENGQYVYRDLESRNPSSINNILLTTPHILNEGDRISIGNGETQLVFTYTPTQYQQG